MPITGKAVLFWTPRVLCLLFAGFLSIFALDVFQEGLSPLRTLAALAIHLIPVYLVLGALALAWRWEVAGSLLFAGLGVWYIVMAWGRFHWSAYVLISGPLFLLAGLFLADAAYRASHGPAPGLGKPVGGAH